MPDAPEALLEHTAFVRSVARAVLRGDDLVEDVVQDTMLTALEESHRRRGPLRAWLGGVARNKAHNLIRRRAAWRRREARVARALTATDGVDELVGRAEEGRRVVAAVLGLDELYRKPILLRYYEGLPPREIARRLDVPVETVRTRIKRGIGRLRAQLARAHSEKPGGWRVALLVLLRLPAPTPSHAPVLLLGGTMLGKKGIMWVVLLLLMLVGGGFWLRPGTHDDGKEAQDARGTRITAQAERGHPRLRGLVPEGKESAEDWPAPVDMTKVDRDRDLHGWVVRADGSPVAGASVSALFYPWQSLGVLTSYDRWRVSEKGPSSVSGADGSFSLSLSHGDLVHLRVRARGLAPTALAFLQAGERVRVVLAEAVRLIVSVTDADGKPVVGMPVRFFVSPQRTGRWLDTTATTGTDGRAVFEELPPSLKGWIDPAPHREGLGSPGWVEIDLPASGDLVHRLQLPPGKTLRGRVVHAVTGEPIEGARVSMTWTFNPAVETDSEGAYEFHGWTKQLGRTLHAVASGFVQDAVEVTEGAVPEVCLQPGRILRGRLVDGKGKPVAGALVSVRRIDRARSATPSLGSDVTHADGMFEVDGLAWAVQVLIAQGVGLGRLVQVIALEAGGDLGDLVLPPPCEVLGTVQDQDGAFLARMAVRLTPREDFDRALHRLERWTDDLGRFRFPDLGPGAYDLSVGPRLEPILQKSIELTVEQPTAHLRLSSGKARSVVVQVVDTEGKPVVGIPVVVQATQPFSTKQVKTGEDGRVALQLFRRPYRVFVTPTGGFARPEPIELDGWQTAASFILERLIPIRGRLVAPDDKPIAWGLIHVTVSGGKKRYVYSDEDGVFVVYVSVGARVSLAFRGKVQNMTRRIDAFVPYVADVGDIAAGTEDLLLRTTALDMSRGLTLRLLDPWGKPVPDRGLQLRTPSNEVLPAQTQTDGRAAWSGLPALPVRPMFSSSRGSPEQAREQPWITPEFETVTPEGQEVVAQFRQGVLVEGSVLKEDGSPAAFAFMWVVEGDKEVRLAVADADGRFVAILDPDFEGTTSLHCKVRASEGKEVLSAVEEVRPGQGPVTLRLRAEEAR